MGGGCTRRSFRGRQRLLPLAATLAVGLCVRPAAAADPAIGLALERTLPFNIRPATDDRPGSGILTEIMQGGSP